MNKHDFLDKFDNFHIIGIKGVLMANIANFLCQKGKKVTGSDVKHDFVTKKLLDKLNIQIQTNFNDPLPADTQCVIYTGAHKGIKNPQVQKALEKNITVITGIEFVSMIFNKKYGIAVCGVGGKSTISAMLSFVLTKMNKKPSYLVGVGEIFDLESPSCIKDDSKFFVLEADEYVDDPNKKNPKPKFLYLKPQIIVVPNIKYDHPDIYKDFDHTKQTFLNFLKNIKQNGSIIFKFDEKTIDIFEKIKQQRPDIKLIPIFRETHTFKSDKDRDLKKENKNKDKDHFDINQKLFDNFYKILQVDLLNNKFLLRDKNNNIYKFNLNIPGLYNIENASLAFATLNELIENKKDVKIKTLEQFKSTKRRFEFKGKFGDLLCFDDYAHHPHEIENLINTINIKYKNKKKIFIFQPHTYSRTKKLFDEFVKVFAKQKHSKTIFYITSIFSSAREKKDPTISSKLLVKKIKQKNKDINIFFIDFKQAFSLPLKYKHEDAILITVGAVDVGEICEKNLLN